MIGVIIVLIITIVVLIISLVYASRASTSIRAVTGYDADKNLAKAYKYLVWISVVGWLAVIALFIGIIAFFVDGGGEAEAGEAALSEFSALDSVASGVGNSVNYVLYGIIALAGALTLAVGVIASIAASAIADSPLEATNKDVQQAYSFAVISAVSSIVSIVLVITAYILYDHYSTPARPMMSGFSSLERSLYSAIPSGGGPYSGGGGYSPPYQQPYYQPPQYQPPQYQPQYGPPPPQYRPPPPQYRRGPPQYRRGGPLPQRRR